MGSLILAMLVFYLIFLHTEHSLFIPVDSVTNEINSLPEKPSFMDCMDLTEDEETSGRDSLQTLRGLLPEIPKNLSTTKSEESFGETLYLTPYITRGSYEEGREKARVDLSQLKVENSSNLDKLESYAGYLTVNSSAKQNLLFWFFPAQEKPDTAPLVLWLEGGPGQSSIIVGVFIEHGPVQVILSPKLGLKPGQLAPRPHTWTKEQNVIYVDNPAQAGFSFGSLSETREEVTENLMELMTQWYKLFPMYKENKLFLAGSDYGGKWSVSLAKRIHHYNRNSQQKVPLTGIALGNAWVVPLE